MTTPAQTCQAELDLGLPPKPPSPELSWPTTDPVTRAGSPVLPPSRLPGIETGLLVHAPISARAATSRLVAHTGLGVVYALEHKGYRGSHLQQVVGPVDSTRRSARTNSILVDRNLYSGRSRKYGGEGLDAQWVKDQHEFMGLPWALTDSGFCSTRAQVRDLWNSARRLPGRVIVALPIPTSLLTDHTDDLIDLIREGERPVALMLQHKEDPFSVPGVVSALLKMLSECPEGVSLLRADASTLGALAHGVQLAAIGTTSGYRHIYPPSNGGFQPPLSIFIPGLLRYSREHLFAAAYLADPASGLWRCPCWFCGHRDLTWITARHPSLWADAAYQHAAAALAMLGADLTHHPDGPARRWQVLCQEAARRHHELENGSADPRWEPPAFLEQWAGLPAAVAG